jgi:hypothetical protein
MLIEKHGIDTAIMLEQQELQAILACLSVAVDGAPENIAEVILPILRQLEDRWEEIRGM